jgi:autotransporter-associated beta strand protein
MPQIRIGRSVVSGQRKFSNLFLARGGSHQRSYFAMTAGARSCGALRLFILGGTAAFLLAQPVRAQNATWKGTTSGEWTLGTNWSSTPSVPTGTATFTTGAATTSVFNNNLVNIGALVFTSVPNAPAYTFNVNRNFAINGAGIVNNSTSTQTFNVNNNSSMVFNSGSANSGGGKIVFNVLTGFLELLNSSTAASTTINVTGLGILGFADSANAGHATINASGLLAGFLGSSTAANATINNTGVSQLVFSNSSNAGNATINNSNIFAFKNTSSAASATINNTGSLNFEDSSSAGNANINQVAGNKAMMFNTLSTASSAHIINDGSIVRFGGGFFDAVASPTAANAIIENKNRGFTEFVRQSTAGNATIINSGSGVVSFGIFTPSLVNGVPTIDQTKGTGSAGNATIINTESGATIFYNQSTAGTATITNNSVGNRAGGVLAFFSTSDGSTARVFNNIRGTVDISNAKTGTSIGSVEGEGNIYLGSKKLTLGNTNVASAAIGGVISDCGPSGANCVTGAGSIGGSLLKVGTGTLILSGANTYTGGTTISAGALQLGNGGASGSIVGNVLDNGIFAINRSDAFTLSAVISGSGAFEQRGTGTTTLTAKNTYTGATTVTAGTLAVTAGGSITSNVTNNAGFNNAGTVNGSLTNNATGSVINNGVWFGGVSNAGMFNNNLGGLVDTLINTAGITVNNGAIAREVTVNGGVLTGAGAIGGDLLVNRGTFAPGNGTPHSAMLVLGNLAFQSGAQYLVTLDQGTSTGTAVFGTASLDGRASAAFVGGSPIEKRYIILNAQTLTGRFNSIDTMGMPGGFQASLSYDAHRVFLDLDLNFAALGGLNANQQAAANALSNFFNKTGSIPLLFGALGPAGLTQISGETATGSQQTTFNAMNQFMDVMTDPFIAGRGDPVLSSTGATPFAEEDGSAGAYAANGNAGGKAEREAYAAIYRKAPVIADPFTQRWSVWVAGYGGSQTTDGNTVLGSNNTRSSIGGVAVGADYRFSPYTIAGFALAGGGTNFSVNGLGSGRSDLFQAGAFVRHNVGAAYLTGALAYGWQDITTDRTVTIAGADLLRANFNANAFSGRAEGGYRFVMPWIGGVGITPYAAGQFTTFDLPAYAEQAIAGANTFALAYASKSATDTRSELGLRTDKSYPMQSGIFTLRGRAAWAHDFNTDRSITPTFQTLPGASFVVNGAAPAPDSALVTGSAEMKWLNGFALAATFEGEFSGVTRSYAGKGVARYAW